MGEGDSWNPSDLSRRSRSEQSGDTRLAAKHTDKKMGGTCVQHREGQVSDGVIGSTAVRGSSVVAERRKVVFVHRIEQSWLLFRAKNYAGFTSAALREG